MPRASAHVHVLVDEAVGAVLLAHLARQHGDVLRDRRQRPVPARLGVAVGQRPLVDVERRHQVAGRIVRLVLQPPVEVVRPLDAARDDDLLGAGGAHGVQHLLHARDLPLRDGAAVSPAPPRGVSAIGAVPEAIVGVQDRLVEQVEDHHRIVLERGRDRRPEVDRVIGERHRDQLVAARAARDHRAAGRRPVQVQHDVEVALVQAHRRSRSMLARYSSPPISEPLIPSQQCSFSGRRTVFMFQVNIA